MVNLLPALELQGTAPGDHDSSEAQTCEPQGSAPTLALLILLCAKPFLLQAARQHEQFSEEVVVSPLHDGRVLLHFQFSQAAPHQRHYTILPLSISQLASAVPFSEVELSLTQGRWHYHRWDQPLVPVKPAGAELQAVFERPVPKSSLPALWSTVSHALGGLFCASLHFVARPETTAVQAIMATQHLYNATGNVAAEAAARNGDANSSSRSGSVTWRPVAADKHVLYAALPQEASCTENLTPWLKLLPCRDAAGLAQLLKRRDIIFGAEYYSLRVSLRVQRGQNLEPLHHTLTQTLTLVLDPSSSSSSKTRSAAQHSSLPDIDLNQLMGNGLESACPIAQQSRVYMLLPGVVSQQQQQQQLVQGLVSGCTSETQAAVDGIAAGPQESKEDVQQDPADNSGSADEIAAGAADEVQDKDQSAAAARCCRQLEMEVPLSPESAVRFKLSPGPDAVALLQQQAGIASSAVADSTLKTDKDQADSVGACSSSSSDVELRHRGQQHLMYVYNVRNLWKSKHRRPKQGLVQQAAAKFIGGDPKDDVGLLPIKLTWTQQSSSGGSSGSRGDQSGVNNQSTPSFTRLKPSYAAHRYIVGSGNLHGGMVLELHATEPAAAAGDVGVCIFQVVPWYVRLWLHTLQLTIDGQVSPLSQHLLLRHVSTAQDRARPLVLNLCLRIPAAAHRTVISARFSKAFLTAFEHPPDAHRGFDVPAAQVTYLGPISAVRSQSVGQSYANSGDGVGGGVSKWNVYATDGRVAGLLNVQTSLMQSLAELRPQKVYSPGLVVPLAVPDFSMPYNVICLTSTVLAVFFGAILNMLLLRPGEEQRMLAAGKDAGKAARRKKKLKLIAVVVVFGGLAIYIDPAVQETVVEQLKAVGFMQ